MISHRWSIWLVAGVCATLLVVGPGCPGVPAPGDNTNDNTDGDGEVTAQIVSFSQNFGVSALDPPISVLYTVTGTPDSIAGFYVPVADESAGSAPIGERVIVVSALSPGTNRAFSFDPAAAGIGYYRVGLIVMVDGVELTPTPLSTGVIQVQGPPEPRFIQPADAVTGVWKGDDLFISFDAGDPEGDVRWRLFYLAESDSRDNPPDELGTQIKTGSGNVGSATLSTSSMNAGEYEIGLSATDSGFTIATTVANGDLDRIVTIPNDLQSGPIIRVVDTTEVEPPLVVFTDPGASGVALFRDEAYTLRFRITISEPGATGYVELFYDDDDEVDNGYEDTIAEDLPASATSYPLPTNLPEGVWYIGATVRTVGGISPATTYYAPGTIEIVQDPTLTVNAPNSPLPVPPSTPVAVAWTTNAPLSSGNLDVFARIVGPAGAPEGPEIAILTAEPMTTAAATFTSTESGLFEISVRLNLVDGTSVTEAAPKFVRVSTLPRILWLGSLADADPPFEGAVFGGVQPEDNAGSALCAAGDLDGDNAADFVIAARYGKPFFDNPDGIGAGEAYIVYGGGTPLLGEYNLNSVGTAGLRGLTLTGIRTVDANGDTDGLATVATIPDADDDGIDELAFGFPRTDSATLRPSLINPDIGPLEKDGVFLSGGVVILSSQNSLLANPEGGIPVIALDVVGRQFDDVTVVPSGGDLAFDDQLTFQEGDPDADPPTQDGCVDGTDGEPDTIIGPSVGFWDQLAPPLWEQEGLTFYSGPPAPDLCPTRYDYDVLACPEDENWQWAGSGFYPAAATPLEPLGVRLIGPAEGDGFGTSISSTRVFSGIPRGDLLVSAPNRTGLAVYVEELSANVSGAGVAMLFNNRTFWGPDDVFLNGETPPTPHQYTPGFPSHCGDGRADPIGAARIVGDSNDAIQTVLGIDDFNGDAINDIAVGAPASGGGQGRVYVAYRRQGGSALEGNFILGKLQLPPTDSERLDGMLIVTNGSTDALGSSLATDLDFNDDGVTDLVIGSPNASGGVGEVLIVFGDPGIVSGSNGISVDALLTTSRTTDGGPVAIRIAGNARDSDGQLGFNVANAGDVDGDGTDDLLIAAPGGTPRFDPFPNDGDDTLSEKGLDLDFDGIKDDVSGPAGRPDGIVDAFDDLSEAGIVYIVLGSNRLDQIKTCSETGKACSSDAECLAGEVCSSAEMTISIDQLGTANLRGFMLVGRDSGDRLGGGDAGDPDMGGKANKLGRGRSTGLASAGDVDGDGRSDILIGAVLADPRRDPNTGVGVENGGEVYLVYGAAAP
jgi:hypothetical protein